MAKREPQVVVRSTGPVPTDDKAIKAVYDLLFEASKAKVEAQEPERQAS